MPVELAVQSATGQLYDSIADLIATTARDDRYDTLGAAAAYVSVAGVHLLLDALDGTGALANSRWLFGLDDCLTHPTAVDIARTLPGAEVRVAGERVTGRRFHPKVYALTASRAIKRAAVIVGSANLTRSGLEANVEAAIAHRASSRTEGASVRQQWERLWALGRTPDARLLESYKADFTEAQSRRPSSPSESSGLILIRDTATVDPAHAHACWIEVGNITGFQAEQLEIKAEQALFFGLPPSGGQTATVDVRLRNGSDVSILARYYGNAMWRFNLPQSIPEVHAGLRPGGQRSPYAALFERAANSSISLTFVPVSGRRYASIKARSRRAGTLGSTAAREYGWY